MSLPPVATDADAVLIDGPYLTGKRRLFHSLLRSWTDKPVVISTQHIDDRIRRIHEQATGADTEEPIIVDCVSAAHVDNLVETPQTRYAAGPGNLTDIGTTVVNVLESRRDEDLAVGIATLSPLMVYTSVESVFQFTQLLVNQTTSQGWPIVAITDSEISDDPKHRAIRQPFDVVIETRQSSTVDGVNIEAPGDDAAARLFRIRDRDNVTEWQPVSSM